LPTLTDGHGPDWEATAVLKLLPGFAFDASKS
jgi:hypothetical protein